MGIASRELTDMAARQLGRPKPPGGQLSRDSVTHAREWILKTYPKWRSGNHEKTPLSGATLAKGAPYFCEVAQHFTVANCYYTVTGLLI